MENFVLYDLLSGMNLPQTKQDCEEMGQPLKLRSHSGLEYRNQTDHLGRILRQISFKFIPLTK